MIETVLLVLNVMITEVGAGEAKQRKQAVYMKVTDGESDVEGWQGGDEESGTINALANVECYLCKEKKRRSKICCLS